MNTDCKAYRELSAMYFAQVRSIAEEAMDIEDAEERYNWIFESVEGHEYIIYTHKAQLVAVFTNNEDAYYEAVGEIPCDENGNYISTIALFAMAEDVLDLVRAIEATAAMDTATS